MNSTDSNQPGTDDLFFGWLDFFIFGLMLTVSTIIGIYFGFWGKKEDTPKEYLHGGKKMSTLPVAVSLVSSFLSGVTSLGAPTEIYIFGTLYILICISCVLIGFINYYIYLPVFFELQLTSTYEYLQMRFNRGVRIMASVLCTIGLLLYIPIVIYVPALAFSQVSGFNVHFLTPAIAALCIFYTMLGGIKAVVWTDLLQGVVTVVASLAVIVLGLVHVGGFGTVWETSSNGGRIRFLELSISPLERITLWNVVFGFTFHWGGMILVNQAMVQKFLSLPTFSKAKTSLCIFVAGLILINVISSYTGLLMYATYHKCDPLKAKGVSRPDQLLPYYVMDIASSIPGLPGLFIAGIFSASLSTMSSSLNALGATMYEDFVRPCIKSTISEKTASNIIKSVVVIIGAICVLNMTIVVAGVTNGAMLGLFSFGMLYPRGNSKGALVGSITSMLVMSWMIFGNQKAKADGVIKEPELPMSVEGCGFNMTLIEEPLTEDLEQEVSVFYRISFMYYSTIGWIIMFVVGVVVSLMTEAPDLENINPALFTPLVRKYVLNRIKNGKNKEAAEIELLKTNSTE